MLNSFSPQQINSILLWYLVQHSLSSFSKLVQHYGSVAAAVQPEHLLTWSDVRIHANHLQRAKEYLSPTGQLAFEQCLNQLQQQCDFVLTLDDADYPNQLRPYANRPPILFGQGNAQALLQAQIAIVGSRKASPHGRQVAYDFAYYLSEQGFFINSGLAQGIDEAAHQGALQHQRTIAVMGTGLDSTYPSAHHSLRQQIVESGGAVITEFLPQTKPLQQHFPRRNRIVSGLSLGVIVAEASLKSGSLITAKLAAEQGKLIFAIPGHIYSEFHQGCHQLIREGAILVDHPEQVIEDLALPTQWQYQQNQMATKPDQVTTASIRAESPTLQTETTLLSTTTKTTDTTTPHIPEHLLTLYQQLDWVGQSIDYLAQQLNLDIATLTSALMELELMGFCLQQSGLYLRCRPHK